MMQETKGLMQETKGLMHEVARVRACICVYACACVCPYVCFVCLCVCMCVCMYVYACPTTYGYLVSKGSLLAAFFDQGKDLSEQPLHMRVLYVSL